MTVNNNNMYAMALVVIFHCPLFVLHNGHNSNKNILRSLYVTLASRAAALCIYCWPRVRLGPRWCSPAYVHFRHRISCSSF